MLRKPVFIYRNTKSDLDKKQDGIKTGHEKAPKKMYSNASDNNLPKFNPGIPLKVRNSPKPGKILKKHQSTFTAPQLVRMNFLNQISKSIVYKCDACRLCFDRPEIMFRHLNNCTPRKEITRIHCICGLEFDKYNYDHHCDVHLKFTIIHVKKISVDEDECIHVSGLKKEFLEDEVEDATGIKISVVDVKKTEGTVNHDDITTGIFGYAPLKDYKASVYKCKCGLCFERSEFMFEHLDNCFIFDNVVRIRCICGLEFDKHNYDHHCDVHRKYTMLRVKKISVNDEKFIDVSGMRYEFEVDKEDGGTKAAVDKDI